MISVFLSLPFFLSLIHMDTQTGDRRHHLSFSSTWPPGCIRPLIALITFGTVLKLIKILLSLTMHYSSNTIETLGHVPNSQGIALKFTLLLPLSLFCWFISKYREFSKDWAFWGSVTPVLFLATLALLSSSSSDLKHKIKHSVINKSVKISLLLFEQDK